MKEVLFISRKGIYIPLLLINNVITLIGINKVNISPHTNNGGYDISSYQMG